MENRFSLFDDLETNIRAIADIDDSVKITLGPTGKNGISINKAYNLNFLTNGAALIEFLEFEKKSANIIRQLFQQAASKTFMLSGDGSTTTILLLCQLLKTSINPTLFQSNSYQLLKKANSII